MRKRRHAFRRWFFFGGALGSWGGFGVVGAEFVPWNLGDGEWMGGKSASVSC